MPKLQHETKIKKEVCGIRRHDCYKLVIPYGIALQFQIQDKMMLHATASAKTRTIRLHKTKTQDSIPVKVRQKMTKTYKNQRYHSARITIPIRFVRDLYLAKNQLLDVSYTIHSIVIRPAKSKNVPKIYHSCPQ